MPNPALSQPVSATPTAFTFIWDATWLLITCAGSPSNVPLAAGICKQKEQSEGIDICLLSAAGSARSLPQQLGAFVLSPFRPYGYCVLTSLGIQLKSSRFIFPSQVRSIVQRILISDSGVISCVAVGSSA